MPASGGMAGTSIAQPQDLISGINANPATITQFHGTQFVIGGAYAEPTFNLTQTGSTLIPAITPFSAKSSAGGAAVPNVGVTQELDAYGVPVTLGLGLIGSAGAGTNFRQEPGSNRTSTYLSLLEFAGSAGVRLTERLSAGGTLFVGSGYLDGPFVGNGAMTNAFALRGGVGLGYAITDDTQFGIYYQSVQRFRFKDEAQLEFFDGTFDVTRDVRLSLPQTAGVGLSNSSLCDGRLLLAADVLFMDWSSAALFRSIYRNQWVAQVGTQYTLNDRCKLRLGYAYAENPIDPNAGTSVAGIPVPGGIPAVKYLQAQFAVINQHRIAAGVGITDILPGVDFDAFGGGMLPASDQLGEFTRVDVLSYWVGLGITWRFDRGCTCTN